MFVQCKALAMQAVLLVKDQYLGFRKDKCYGMFSRIESLGSFSINTVRVSMQSSIYIGDLFKFVNLITLGRSGLQIYTYT